MTGSVSLAIRRAAAPVALLLVVTLSPVPRFTEAAASTTRGSVAAAKPVTTLLRTPGALPAAPAPGAGAAQPACAPANLPPSSSVTVPATSETKLSHDEAQVTFKAGAVKSPRTVVASSLCGSGLAPMDQAMTNVTDGPRRGYRLLPHQTFIESVTITLPYDPALIPLGLTELDVYTYYWDEGSATWRALERVSVDAEAHTVTSLSDHFTDFVNATLTVPDHPETLSYDPTSIKDIKAADPGSGIGLVAPPQGNNTGAATLAYPIELPPGRQGLAPSLGLAYNSGDGNGWLGLGWNLSVPSVTIETRWGVPRYSAAQETETYQLGPQQLTPVAHRGTLQARSAEKVFHTRRESDFATIRRHGASPSAYWWEVIEKNGNRWFYGGTPETGQLSNAVLADGSGNVFRWALREVRDLNGNAMRYSYDTVSDVGVAGGTVAGRELYLRSINYTATAAAPGPYTVTFVRDSELPGYSRRPDVQISARGGFKMVTAERLGRIDVSFNGALVRRYDLTYAEGAFRKTLLRSVTQRGGSGAAFHTHEFAYYDDIRDGSGAYQGFAAPANWGTGSDGVSAGLLGRGQASALSGTEGTSVGGHLYVGFNPLAPRKQGSAGGKVGFTRSTHDGVLAMVDLNGDGLPDKVFKDGSGIRFRLNTSGPDGSADFAGSAASVPTLPDISEESSDTGSFGAEVYLVANVFVNQAFTFSEHSTYFSDVNGDGFMDLVADGRVLFNHLNDAGVPTFTENSADTPVRVDSGSVDPDGLIDDFEAIYQQRVDNYPLTDTLRRWVAPFDGRVRVQGNVALVQDTSPERAAYRTADGVRVTVQHNGSELWTTTIEATDFTPKTPGGVDSVAVSRGDRLYFRVQSIVDGAFDQVSWDPEITYLDVTPVADVNNLGAYRYRASEDFTFAGRTGIGTRMPFAGTVKLGGDLRKLGPTTDDVTVLVLRNGTTVYTTTLAATATTTVTVDPEITVAREDDIQLRIKVDSPIDVSRLEWTPSLFYLNTPDVSPIVDPLGNPIIRVHPPYDVDTYPLDDLTAPQQAWTAPATGTVTVTPDLPTVTPATTTTVTFTAKRRVTGGPGVLVAKRSIAIVGGVVPDASFPLNVTAGDQIYFDFSVPDPAVTLPGATVRVDGDTVPSAVHRAATQALLARPYRGWQYAGYNGNRDRALAPIVEADLEQPFDEDSGFDPRTAKAYPFFPFPERGSWRGTDELTFVTAATMSSSRQGLDDITVPRPSDFAGGRAVTRVSQASQTAIGGGVSFLSGSVSTGSATSQVDFLDLNGDRFPDVVSSGQAQYSTPTGGLEAGNRTVPGLSSPRSSDATAVNVGVGGSPAAFFANGRSDVDTNGKAPQQSNTTGTQMQPLGLAGTLGRGDSRPDHDLLDVNGDGLPDRVINDGGQLRVALNLGYAFAPAEPWGAATVNDGASENGSIGASLGFNSGIYEFGGGVSLTKNKTQTSQTLVDINGDGQLDRLLPNGDALRVGFNTGNGFAAPVTWAGALNGPCRDSTSVGLAGIDWDEVRICSGTTGLGGGAYFTFGIPLCLAACYIVINPGADGSESMARDEAQLRDIDGDGFADHLASTDDSSVQVARNRTGRTNLLKTVSRPLGATISLEYERSGNTTADPQSRWVLSRTSVADGHPGDGVDTQVTAFRYDNGVFDRNEREFRGYGTVVEQTLDGTGAVYRTNTRDFRTDSFYTKGLISRVVTADGAGRRFVEAEQTFVLRDVDTGAEPADPASTTATVFPMLVRTDSRFIEGGPTAAKSTFTTQHFDAVGNVDRATDAGDDGAGDDVLTTIAYSACVRDKPVSMTSANGATVMRRREGTVDCVSGKTTQIREFPASGPPAVTDMEYNSDGNLRRVTSPANATGQLYQLSYEYDAATATQVARVTNSFGLTSTSTYDSRFGRVASTVDVNDNLITYVYDEFGRTVSVTGPYDTPAAPTIRFEYHPEAAIPWALTRHRDSFRSATDTVDTVQFIDGLGRPLQTKKDSTIHTGPSSAAQDVMSVTGRIVFDHIGRTIEARYPTTEPLGTPGVFRSAADSVAPTRTAYDILDRVTSVTLPDTTTTTTTYGFGPDRSGTTQLLMTVTDANGNVKRTYTNTRGLTTSVQERHNGQPIWTSYAYDALNQILTIKDDHNNTTTAVYDNFGRRTSTQTPDSGRTDLIYDLAGNITAKVTANLRAAGQQINYRYDFGRLINVTYPGFTGNNITYTYGAAGASENRAGRITRVVDESGTQDRFFGKLGETVREIRLVATDTGPAETYTTQYTYDTFGRMQSMVYPDGEVLTYSYDSGGMMRAASGVKEGRTYAYVNRLEYDKFGERAFMAAGNGTQTSFAFDPLDRLLTRIQAGNATGLFQNLQYTYDDVGNVLTLANQVPVPPASQDGGPFTQTYEYDDLYRLIGATGSYEYEPGKLDRYTFAQTYDSIHNVVSKQQHHEVVQPPGTPIVQQKTTFDSDYQYAGSGPHAASHIGDLSFTYDANGNQTGWTDDTSGQRRTITWDEENRIQSLFDNGHEKAYKYNADGERVIKRGPQGETAYVNAYFSVRNRQIGTKHIFAGSTRVASKLMKRNAEEKDRYFFHPDQVGSNSFITDSDGKIYRHTEFFPSGESWIDEASNKQRTPYLYAGKEFDEETGLYYYGARYYDPRTSAWQSTDPAIGDFLPDSDSPGQQLPGRGGFYNPRNLNLYGYAHQNPVGSADPDGQRMPDVRPFPPPPEVAPAPNRPPAPTVPRTVPTPTPPAEPVPFWRAPLTWVVLILAILSIPGDTRQDTEARDEMPDEDPILAEPAAAAQPETANRTRRRERDEPPTYVTYYKINEATRQVYIGRSSGWGDPRAIVRARDLGHNMPGFSEAELDEFAPGTLPWRDRHRDPAYQAIRGREQQGMDYFGGPRSWRVPTQVAGWSSSNLIRGYGRFNRQRHEFHNQSNIRFGPLAPYTGAP